MAIRIFHALQRAHGSVFRAADKSLKAALGVSATQAGVLFFLADRDGAPISDIAEALSMGNSSLTGLIDRMAAQGLVTRGASKDDGRVVCVHLQPLGEQIAKAAIAPTRRINANLLSGFSRTERRTIERFLLKLATDAPSVIRDEWSKGEVSHSVQARKSTA
ncbi:MAG: MarR family transcriptional regulator [Alphaproteobacteria bacterium]|nr:MarR family transcriptional regulator [Alphaproteobacteria bacterium]